MSKTRNLSDLLDANGDVKSTALDNVPPSNDASALTTGTLPNARLSAVPNSALANSSITINGSATSLGGSATINTDLVNDTTPQLGGNLDSNGNAINMADNNQINFGNSTDGRIVHNGTDFIIQDLGTGDLKLVGDQVRITDGSGAENKAVFTSNGSADLYYDNAKKFETTSSGATVTGTLTADGVSLGDSDVLNLGASNDLQISHDGNNSLIADTGTGDLFIRGSNNIYLQNAGGTTMSRLASGAGNYLYYNGSQKFETTSTGATVTGNLNVTGSISGAGKVGQVIQTVKTDTASTSSSTFSAISGLNATITPSSTSSKILASVQLHVGQSNSTTAVFKLYRGNQAVGHGGANGNHQTVGFRVSPDNIHWTFPVSYEYLDSPSTTSAITYYVYWRNNGNTVYINRNNSFNNDTSNDQSIPISTITLMEILP